VYFQNEISNSSGIITVVTNRIGDVGLILRMVFMFNFGDLNIISIVYRKFLISIYFFFIILGALTKRAQLPFSA